METEGEWSVLSMDPLVVCKHFECDWCGRIVVLGWTNLQGAHSPNIFKSEKSRPHELPAPYSTSAPYFKFDGI